MEAVYMKRLGIAVLCAALLCLSAVLAGCSSGDTYKPELKESTLSSSALGEEGVLRVGVNTSNPPLAGQTTDIVGIDVDVAASIADELGLKLQVVDVKNDAADALEKGEIDIAMGIESSNEDKVWRSENYLTTGVALFSTKSDADVPKKGDDDLKIAAQGSSMSAYAVTNQFGKKALSSSADLQSAFNELSAGDVSFVAADAIIGSYAAYTSGMSVNIIAMAQKPTGYVIACSKKNDDLQSAISSTLETLQKGGVIGAIEKRWLGTSLNVSELPLTADAE